MRWMSGVQKLAVHDSLLGVVVTAAVGLSSVAYAWSLGALPDPFVVIRSIVETTTGFHETASWHYLLWYLLYGTVPSSRCGCFMCSSFFSSSAQPYFSFRSTCSRL